VQIEPELLSCVCIAVCPDCYGILMYKMVSPRGKTEDPVCSKCLRTVHTAKLFKIKYNDERASAGGEPAGVPTP